jgi:hypothetical protein
METNSPQTNEAIFIVSNNRNSPSVKNGSENYSGELFRSATFELANYHPFNFSANITSDAGEVFDSDVAVGVNEVPFKLSFDITSFEGTDGSSVDPFGTAFDVYIDAPMFELNTDDPLTSGLMTISDISNMGKAKLEQTADGRIIYRVTSNRELESAVWMANGHYEKAAVADPKAASQMGERKCISLKPKNKTAIGGTITISADPEIITFNSQTFDVTCKALSFDLKFGTDKADAPVGHSVSFYNKTTGERIYSTTISEEGKCEFRFNPARPFDMDSDEVVITMQNGGKYYSAEVMIGNLATAGTVVELSE